MKSNFFHKFKSLLILAGLAVLLYHNFSVNNDVLSFSSDTTIVVNNYYDTSIKQIIVQNISNPVKIVKIHDSLNAPGLCDSIRTYHPKAENDTIKISGEINVQGRLLDYDLSYKWKLPWTSEKTITITNEKVLRQKGVFLGISTNFSGKSSEDSPLPDFGPELLYLTRKGYIFSYNYNLNSNHRIGLSKLIFSR